MAFNEKPVLIFWETTRRCSLRCMHCRASAISSPLPGELTAEEGFRLLEQIQSFGKPYPLLVLTGGDPLERPDIYEQIKKAKELGINCAISPAVTEKLSKKVFDRIKENGCGSVSISLDGATAETHDTIRRVPGTFDRTLSAIHDASEAGLKVQVNTVVMGQNFMELPEIFKLIRSMGVKTWELFFLINIGRGTTAADMTPEIYEEVCNFVYDASFYGTVIRCVEAPFIRRIRYLRDSSAVATNGKIYEKLVARLYELEGKISSGSSTLSTVGTLDGDGGIFIGYDGSIYPGGFMPYELGNVKTDPLANIYRENRLLKKIRNREFKGACGYCEFRQRCGGSRARAYALKKDPLETDPACLATTKLIRK